MRLLPEPPMHIDSELSANIQFADWVAAYVTRAIDYQLVKRSDYGWIVGRKRFNALQGSFTYESKLRLWKRDLEDLHHSDIIKSQRSVWPEAEGQLLAAHIDPDRISKMRGIAAASHR